MLHDLTLSQLVPRLQREDFIPLSLSLSLCTAELWGFWIISHHFLAPYERVRAEAEILKGQRAKFKFFVEKNRWINHKCYIKSCMFHSCNSPGDCTCRKALDQLLKSWKSTRKECFHAIIPLRRASSSQDINNFAFLIKYCSIDDKRYCPKIVQNCLQQHSTQRIIDVDNFVNTISSQVLC